MADPLLTSLCAICHVSPPKYKCPRCRVQTCSQGCVEKHKKWSECSGQRDQTAYVPPHKLRTAAGIDHDYNFLYSLDRQRAAAEQELEEKGLISRSELHPVMVEHVQERRGRDGRVRRVIATKPAAGHGGAARRLMDDGMRARLREFDITLVRAPPGLAKGRASTTRFTKARRRIEWQVEWVVARSAFPAEWAVPAAAETEGKEDAVLPGAVRLLTKTMDDCPVGQGLAAALRQLDPQRQQTKRVKKVADEAMSGVEVSVAAVAAAGEASSSSAAEVSAVAAGMSIDELSERFVLYLRQQRPVAASRVGLRPVDAARGVGENLRGATVFEYPTVYVFERVNGPAEELVMEAARVAAEVDTTSSEGEWSESESESESEEEEEEGEEDEDQDVEMS